MQPRNRSMVQQIWRMSGRPTNGVLTLVYASTNYEPIGVTMDEVDETYSETIWNLLVKKPGLTGIEIAKELGKHKSIINKHLYAHQNRFWKSEVGRPRWYVVDDEESRKPFKVNNGPDRGSTNFEVSDLRKWQEEALDAWIGENCCGMVEAVTGAGKTRFALAAVAHHLTKFPMGKAVVIVPSIELQQQWKREIDRCFSGMTVGRMGGGYSDTLKSCTILVAVVNKASTSQLGLSESEPGLLIVDECHTIATKSFRHGLEEQFVARLGISATIERGDGAEETILEPYFGRVVYSLGYRQALDFGFIAHMRVATIGVDLDPDTRSEYDGYTEAIGIAWSTLINKHGIPAEPYSRFMKEVSALSTGGTMSEGIAANNYLGAVRKRRKLVCEANGKLGVLRLMVDSIQNSNGTLVFSETIDGSDLVVNKLTELGVSIVQVHSSMTAKERTAAFTSFARGEVKAISAVKVIDQGIDVPEADLAIILATSKTRRQMIQRMGRVLRLKDDGRLARFALVYVRGTGEDPSEGAHSEFFGEVLAIADDSEDFSIDSAFDEITDFLSP